jgi:hypothetical protein
MRSERVLNEGENECRVDLKWLNFSINLDLGEISIKIN